MAWIGVVGAMSLVVASANESTPRGTTNSEALSVGVAMPPFASTDDMGQLWKSADHIGKKVLVLYFYPGDFTGGCTRQARAYREALAKLEELGAEVVGVSGDSAATHKLFKEAHLLTHTLLADREGELAKLLGIPIMAGGQVRATDPDRRPLFNADGERIYVKRRVTLARRTFVVDREGKIASLRTVTNPVTDAEEVRRIVEALRKN
jgi:peroxiredoxin Q/BCP